MNKHLAYCYLYDDPADLKCDFEIATDEMSSMIGLLRSLVDDEKLKDELIRINELMYHINPSLRTTVKVTAEELKWLEGIVENLQRETADSFNSFPPERKLTFVLPQGSSAACYSHIIRNRCKALARLLYRHKAQGNTADDILFDFINLYSGYFYFLALKLNKVAGIKETPFTSRNYK
jgi:ATP:cob(I)alamin adenosyltransferase